MSLDRHSSTNGLLQRRLLSGIAIRWRPNSGFVVFCRQADGSMLELARHKEGAAAARAYRDLAEHISAPHSENSTRALE
ncbi:MAG TPA: hypothetical protein VMC10_19435 [Stellaceae bacterium]|nr:hypothetical protein [Stellaceae bacterium]